MPIPFRIFLFLFVILSSCGEPTPPKVVNESAPTSATNTEEANNNNFPSNITHTLPTQVNAILQDKNNNYWFVSNGQGVYRYDPRPSGQSETT